MKWTTPAFTSILVDLFPQYKDSKGAEREDVIKEARNKIKDLAKKNGESLPSQLSEVSNFIYISWFTP